MLGTRPQRLSHADGFAECGNEETLATPRLNATMAGSARRYVDEELNPTMNVTGFTEPQLQALLDLALLAMYSDGHLALVEDERIQRLLTAMGFSTDFDRGRQYDAAVSRVSRRTSDLAAARSLARELSQTFSTPDHRRRVHLILDDLVASDNRVAPQEGAFIAVVQEALRL